MNYAVIWSPKAEAALTRIWLAARDRSRVREAADQLELRLARDPNSFGESRSANLRVAFQEPLVIQFEVDQVRKRVTVAQVLRTKR